MSGFSRVIYQCQRSTQTQQAHTCLSLHLWLPHNAYPLHQNINPVYILERALRILYRFQDDRHFLFLSLVCLDKTSSLLALDIEMFSLLYAAFATIVFLSTKSVILQRLSFLPS